MFLILSALTCPVACGQLLSNRKQSQKVTAQNLSVYILHVRMCTKIHVKWLDGGRGIYTFKSFVKVWPNPKGVEQHFDLNVSTVH